MLKPFICAEDFCETGREADPYRKFLKIYAGTAMKLYTYITGPGDETFCRRICERIKP
jgi:hypothetical protein